MGRAVEAVPTVEEAAAPDVVAVSTVLLILSAFLAATDAGAGERMYGLTMKKDSLFRYSAISMNSAPNSLRYINAV